jgi:hypothetical protein
VLYAVVTGNPGAKAVIDEMRRQGITIKGN